MFKLFCSLFGHSYKVFFKAFGGEASKCRICGNCLFKGFRIDYKDPLLKKISIHIHAKGFAEIQKRGESSLEWTYDTKNKTFII